MAIFNKEIHENLHKGSGIVTTYTSVIWNIFRRKTVKIIFLRLHPFTTIGMHEHSEDSEIYITLNSNVFFSNNVKWKMCNRCYIGNSHSAKNISKRKATIFAIKYWYWSSGHHKKVVARIFWQNHFNMLKYVSNKTKHNLETEVRNVILVRKNTCQNLQGGTGTITCYTLVWFSRRPIKKISILRLEPLATIGMHEHIRDSEIYLTCNLNIILSEQKRWKPWEICRKGSSHFAKNNGHKCAWILAIRYWVWIPIIVFSTLIGNFFIN